MVVLFVQTNAIKTRGQPRTDAKVNVEVPEDAEPAITVSSKNLAYFFFLKAESRNEVKGQASRLPPSRLKKKSSCPNLLASLPADPAVIIPSSYYNWTFTVVHLKSNSDSTYHWWWIIMDESARIVCLLPWGDCSRLCETQAWHIPTTLLIQLMQKLPPWWKRCLLPEMTLWGRRLCNLALHNNSMAKSLFKRTCWRKNINLIWLADLKGNWSFASFRGQLASAASFLFFKPVWFISYLCFRCSRLLVQDTERLTYFTGACVKALPAPRLSYLAQLVEPDWSWPCSDLHIQHFKCFTGTAGQDSLTITSVLELVSV